MSIATLKRKSRRFKAHISGEGNKGFSLNGGHRNQGWVGQDTLGRHLGRTPFRGVVPVGHGGRGGEYKVSIVKGGPCSANDPNIIKRSTMNTPGYIETRVNNPTGVFNPTCKIKCAKKWVQDFNPLNKIQSGHIKIVKEKAANCDKTEKDINGDCRKTFNKEEDITTCKEKCYFVGKKKFFIAVNQKKRNKFRKGAVDAGQYTDIGVLSKKNLPTPPNKAHFPMVLHHLGCDTNYLTPEDAIAAGDLPADWMQ
jgi:hypothetical protein